MFIRQTHSRYRHQIRPYCSVSRRPKRQKQERAMRFNAGDFFGLTDEAKPPNPGILRVHPQGEIFKIKTFEKRFLPPGDILK